MNKTTAAIIVLLLCSFVLKAQDGPQLPGMGFDQWSRKGSTWYPYAENTPEARRVWDSSNKGMSSLGVNSTEPDFEHVAVPGKGKAAAKIRSRKIVWMFVTGNLMTGRFARVVKLSGAEMYFGVPFSGRPKSFSGWYHYVPGIIDYAKDSYKNMLGKQDKGILKNEPSFEFMNRDGLRRLASRSDLYIHCATIEVEGLSALEALQQAVVPVIAKGRLSATPQFALDERSVFEAKNPQDLAAHIDLWLDNDEERHRMAWKYAESTKNYDIQLSIAALQKMFREARAL